MRRKGAKNPTMSSRRFNEIYIATEEFCDAAWVKRVTTDLQVALFWLFRVFTSRISSTKLALRATAVTGGLQ